jgi:hypothetical protein
MKYLRLIGRVGRIGSGAVAGWLAVAAAAFAQQPAPKKEEISGGDYVMAYGVVILCVALGMLFVCRSSSRRDRAKPENYEETKPK